MELIMNGRCRWLRDKPDDIGIACHHIHIMDERGSMRLIGTFKKRKVCLRIAFRRLLCIEPE